MNLELTPEQMQFIERAIASGQYASAEEVLAQVWVIGMKEVGKQIALKIEQDIRERDIVAQLNAADDTDAQTDFIESMLAAKRRSVHLRNCFGDLVCE